jgi:hypothetical protein
VCIDQKDVDSVTVTSFTDNGTWTKSNYAGLTFTQIIATGAGGGGGGADSPDLTNETIGGGGGAGGTAIEMIAAANLNATETIFASTTGGAGGINTGGTGTTGGWASFGSHATGTGGVGGIGSAVNATGCAADGAIGEGGSGGSAQGGDLNIAGGAGSVGSCLAELTNGGTGGASYWGGGGLGAVDPGADSCVAGSTGAAYGSGGGGAACEDATAGATGGNGAGGIVVTMNYTSSSGDLAEWYETKDDVEAGDVVAISRDFFEYDSRLGLQKSSILEKAADAESLVGVVASAPHDTIGADVLGKAKHPRAIALAGRVPVKVSEENGVIHAGDLLTVSSAAGVAMKSSKAGVTLGRALEDSACVEGAVCTVLVMVNTMYTTGALTKVALRDEGIMLDEIPADLDHGRLILTEMIQKKKNIVASSTLSEVNTDRLVAGLEIVTPRVVADTLVANTIEAVDQDLHMRIVEGGSFVLESVASTSLSVTFGTTTASSTMRALSVDALGNALFAGSLTAASFEVGSPEKPGGITMYDDETGLPFCTRIVRGKLETIEGRCGMLATSTPQQNVSPTNAGTTVLASTTQQSPVEEEFATSSSNGTGDAEMNTEETSASSGGEESFVDAIVEAVADGGAQGVEPETPTKTEQIPSVTGTEPESVVPIETPVTEQVPEQTQTGDGG